MKEQNIIVHVMMDDGKQLTFERFTQKTVKGVLSQYKKLVGDIFADLFFRDYHNCDYIQIVRTPDHGWDDSTNYELARFKPSEFFAALV